MTRKETPKKNIVIYQAKTGEIRFRGDFEHDTIWATQAEMAKIFDVNVRTVNEHAKNIFKTKELVEKSVIRKFRITAVDGKKYVVNHYNLDTIISIGYRVNSKKATEFRIWATKTIKQHIVEGYTINPQRIKGNYKNFLKAVERIQKLLPPEQIIPTENILELVKVFADTWLSLESYDEGVFPKKGTTKKVVTIKADELYEAIEIFKTELIHKKEATELFAQEKGNRNLEGIFGNVLQSAFDTEMYPSIEEKAAHFLYFVVKNHPFNDGNKRTGAFTFIWFLQKSGIQFRQKITPEVLTTITLLVAESKPNDKDRMIGLILLLLNK